MSMPSLFTRNFEQGNCERDCGWRNFYPVECSFLFGGLEDKITGGSSDHTDEMTLRVPA
jgi:hypothetical protein